MTLGTFGSTLSDELNRLANGGTYRDSGAMVDEALAAKQWANRENISPYSTDTVGVLNEIAGLGLDKKNWLDFNGVCNYIAGTSGLPAAAALRQIYPTTDLLTGVASYYVDAATPTNWGSLGYVYLNGVAGNYLSTPDATALDVTGDIDLRARVALDDWTPSAAQIIISKYTTATNNRSYRLQVNTDGTLQITWSSLGTSATAISKASTVATGVTDGSVKWVRATLDVDNGASGNDVKFYLSDDGTTWTQLGTTVTTAGTTSIFNSTSILEIGASENASLLTGKVYRAQVLDGIGGTTVLDVNIATDYKSSNLDTFTATTGQTVTVNGVGTIANYGTAGSLLPTTVGSSTAADSNDPKFLAHTGTNYVYLPGVSGNNLSVPDSATFDITGDIDLRVQLAMDDWTPASETYFLGNAGGSAGYTIGIQSNGRPILYWYEGTTLRNQGANATPVITDGSIKWVRATLDVNNGAGQYDVKFYTSDDGITYTQLGTTITGSTGTTSISASSQVMGIGQMVASFSFSVLTGKVFRAQILNGIDGTTVLDVDTSVITSGADTYVVPTTYTGQAGAFFTGTGLSLNGVAGNYVSTPDATQLDITGDLDLQIKVAMADWTPAAAQVLLGKYHYSVNQRSYVFYVNTNGTLGLNWSTTGSNDITKTSTVATGIADGATKWVRVTLDVDNGASGNDVKFWTSDDGTTWTQLGTTVTTAGVTSVYASTATLYVGTSNAGIDSPANGTFYEAIVKSGIDGFTVFDADFTQAPANALRMTESSSYKAVVTLNTTRYATINRSTSGRKSVAVTQPTWLFGTDDYMEVNNRYMAHSTSDENYVYLNGASNNYMSVADNPPLDIAGDLDIQVKLAMDDWTPSVENTLIAKWGSGQLSYNLAIGGGTLTFYWSPNGSSFTSKNSTVATGITDGATKWVRVTLDVDNGAGGNDIKFFLSDDGTTWTQLGATVTTAGIASIFNSTAVLAIGSNSNGNGPAKGEFFRAIIKNGIDGTVVLDADASVITLPSQTTFVDRSSNAYTVTINKSGVGTFVSTGNYLYLPGINSNYASAPDAAALDIVGDIDIRAKIALDDWTPATNTMIVCKSPISGAQNSYLFSVRTSGVIRLTWSPDGVSFTNFADSTVAPTVVDGATLWIRATLDVDNGALGNTVTFFTSADGITWTQLGSPVTTLGVTSIFSSSAILTIGSDGTGANQIARGKFFRAQILNGIGGTVAFDANFENSITSLLQTSFTESSTNGATVTINRSGSTFRSAGVIDAGYLYPGATNTFALSTTDFLNFGATNDATIIAVFRPFATVTQYAGMISKGQVVTGATPGYSIIRGVSDQTYGGYIYGNGGTAANYMSNSNSTLDVSAVVLNRTAQTLLSYTNGTAGTSQSISARGSLSNVNSLFIGTVFGANYADMEFYGAAVFRTVLTTAQIRQVTNYFANREAYL